MRIKLVRDSTYGLSGTVLVIDQNAGEALIKAGIATMSKDMTGRDYKTKALDEEQANEKLSVRTVRKKLP